MFERVLDELPESVRACRRLYEPDTGGYHLPQRHHQSRIGLADVERLRAAHPVVTFDCIETPVADLLCSLVINTRSRLILETGTSRGFSTAHLAAAARCVHGAQARVVTLDPCEVPNRFYRGSALEASIDERRVDSLTQDPMQLSGGVPFDFLFLDSLHSYDHLGREVELYLPHLKLGGLMAMHDTFYYDGLGLVTLQLMQLPGLEVLSFPTHRRHTGVKRSPGVTLFRKVEPIEPGSLHLPRTLDVLASELVNIREPATIVAHLGLSSMRAPYRARRLLQEGPRAVDSAALLEPWEPAPAVAPPAATGAVGAAVGAAVAAPVAAAVMAAPAGSSASRVSVASTGSPIPPAPAVTVEPATSATSEMRRRAFSAAGRGQVDEGIRLLTQALQNGPQDVEVLCDLASLALSSGDLVAAVKLSRHALAYAPDHASSLFALGMALARGGADAPAARALQRVASGAGAEALRAQLGGEAADQVLIVLERMKRSAAVT